MEKHHKQDWKEKLMCKKTKGPMPVYDKSFGHIHRTSDLN